MKHMLEGEPRPIVHVCSGASRFGDVTIDLTHPAAMVRGDARNLPVRDIGAVVIDPPYHMALDERQRFMRGCVAALRPGGVLIVHAPWMPKDNRLELVGDVRVRLTSRGLGFPSAPVLVSKWRLVHTRRRTPRFRRALRVEDAHRAGLRVGALAEPGGGDA